MLACDIGGDLDRSGILDATDIDMLSSAIREQSEDTCFDLNSDGVLDSKDHRNWIEKLRGTYLGDSNLDGLFTTSDIDLALAAGTYQDSIRGNSTWRTGDWNGDGDFDKRDIDAAFQAGGFERGLREPSPMSPETYAQDRHGEIRSIQFEPPFRPGQVVTLDFEIIDGLAVFQGDIILGPADQVNDMVFDPAEIQGESVLSDQSDDLAAIEQYMLVRRGRDVLWPNGIIPFAIDVNIDPGIRTRILHDAIPLIETNTNLRLQPYSGQGDHVLFREPPDNSCSSMVGRQGGEQLIRVSNVCRGGTIAHEILHAAGMWHEHQRNDRDDFVQVNWDNIRDDKEHNYETVDAEGIAIGPYDFDSIMHYPGSCGSFQASGTSGPCIVPLEPLPPGLHLGQRNHLSAGDVAGVNSLYPIQDSFFRGKGLAK